MKVLAVKNWDKFFENNRTREMKKMCWVPVPNKHDGDGFTDLMCRENGIALYGAWNLILQVASKCEPRGTLLRDGSKPHNAASISRQTRSPEQIMQATINACLDIGWLEWKELEISMLGVCPENPAGGCDNPHEGAPSRARAQGMEGNGREEKGIEHTPPTPAACVGENCIKEFNQFWEAYPRKTKIYEAQRAFAQVNAKPALPLILAALQWQTKSEEWRRDGGRYVPTADNYLRDGRWNDEPARQPQSLADRSFVQQCSTANRICEEVREELKKIT